MVDPVEKPVAPEVVLPDGSPMHEPGKLPSPEARAFDRKRDREHNELMAVLANPDSHAWLMRLLGECHPYRANTETDEWRRGAFEGERRIALRIIAEITAADPAGYAKALAQHAARMQKISDEEATIAAREAEAVKANGLINRAKRYIFRNPLRSD